MASETKFCKDCKYFVAYERPDRLDLSDCAHPDCARLPLDHLVTAAPAQQIMCSSARGALGPCGAAAKLFEPKTQGDQA